MKVQSDRIGLTVADQRHDDDLLTVAEAAVDLKVSAPTIYRLIGAGRLQETKVDGLKMVRRADLAAFRKPESGERREKHVYSVEEFASRLGVSTSWVRHKIGTGELRANHPFGGRRVTISAEEAERVEAEAAKPRRRRSG
jgi:excisionase family DNA binding protein